MACYSLDTYEGRSRLYLSETSTSTALRLLPFDTPIVITDFGAIGPAPDQWCTIADLPPLRSAGAFAAFLDDHNSLEPVDVTVRIGADIVLSTHDDGEATFTVPSDLDAFQLLSRSVSPRDLPLLTHSLLSHRGQYVVLGGRGVRTFPTFDEYLRGA
jgi:hypothetical protein